MIHFHSSYYYLTDIFKIPFPLTVTTKAFNPSSLRCFETRTYIQVRGNYPLSFVQHQISLFVILNSQDFDQLE